MQKIPSSNRDLRRYVLKKHLIRALSYAAWLLVFLGGAVMYNQNHQTYPPERLMTGWRLAGWMGIALVSGFFLFRIWKFFSLRALRGTVTSVGFSHSYTSGDAPGALEEMQYDFRLKTVLRITLPNGKRCKLKFEQKIGSYLYYREGIDLIRFYGLPYPLNTDPSSPHGYVCVACGRIHPQKCDFCTSCGLSLIDPATLNQDETANK